MAGANRERYLLKSERAPRVSPWLYPRNIQWRSVVWKMKVMWETKCVKRCQRQCRPLFERSEIWGSQSENECMIIIIKHEPYWTSTYNFFKNRGEQIESRGLCLSRSWHKITLVLTAPGAIWIVFPGFQPSYPRYDEPSSLLRQSGCVDICSKQFGMFCTFRRHVTLHLQHGSWLRGVQS